MVGRCRGNAAVWWGDPVLGPMALRVILNDVESATDAEASESLSNAETNGGESRANEDVGRQPIGQLQVRDLEYVKEVLKIMEIISRR